MARTKLLWSDYLISGILLLGLIFVFNPSLLQNIGLGSIVPAGNEKEVIFGINFKHVWASSTVPTLQGQLIQHGDKVNFCINDVCKTTVDGFFFTSKLYEVPIEIKAPCFQPKTIVVPLNSKRNASSRGFDIILEPIITPGIDFEQEGDCTRNEPASPSGTFFNDYTFNLQSLCVESNWSLTLSPVVCPLSGQQTKNWVKSGSCVLGIEHPVSETFSCVYIPPIPPSPPVFDLGQFFSELISGIVNFFKGLFGL